jgi:hypothetical protein
MNLVHIRLFRLGKEFHRRTGHNSYHTEGHGDLTNVPATVPKEYYTMAAMLGYVVEMDDHGFVCVWYRAGEATTLYCIDLGGSNSFFPACKYKRRDSEMPPYQYDAGRWAGGPDAFPFKPDILTTLKRFSFLVADGIQGVTSLLVTRMRPPSQMVNKALQNAIAQFKEGK